MKYSLIIIAIFLWSLPNISNASCFIASENGVIIEKSGDCETRHAPCSTFKVALSLIGYNEGILIDEETPLWQYEDGYVNWLPKWERAHNPKMWLQNSCVWYSQVLTKKLGAEKLQQYLGSFDYGNKDISGDLGKNNGLTNAWLSSSLEISALEQMDFLTKLLDNSLPLHKHSVDMTKNNMFVQNLNDEWRLYGKTGNGNLLSLDRTQKLDKQVGWFIGWVQGKGRVITFVNLIVDEKPEETYASLRAKADAIILLQSIVQNDITK